MTLKLLICACLVILYCGKNKIAFLDYHNLQNFSQAFLKKTKVLITISVVAFSTFFLTQVLSVSPVYLFFLVATVFIFFEKATNFRFSLPLGAFLPFFPFSLVIAYQLLNGTPIKPFFLIGVGYSFFYITSYLISGSNLKRFGQILWFSNVFNLILFVAEFLYRFYFALEASPERILVDGFYVLKYQSFMFMDSNPVGMILMLLFFLNVWLSRNGVTTTFFKFVFGLLLILSFSRAAIFAALICLIGVKMFDKAKSGVFILGTGILLLFVAWKLFEISVLDHSFLLRVEIVSNTLVYLQNCSLWEMLWGLGEGTSVKILGRGAHNMFVYLLIEYGMIGIITWLFFHFTVLYYTKFKSLILLSPFFIAGQLFAPLVIPYYFAFAAFGYEFLEEKRILFNRYEYEKK